jgi:hypothetical protein
MRNRSLLIENRSQQEKTTDHSPTLCAWPHNPVVMARYCI